MNDDKMTTLDEMTDAAALGKIALALLEQKKKDHSRLWIITILLIIVNLLEAGLFVWYETHTEVVESTVTTTVEQDTGSGEGNNVYLSGEKATYNQGDDSSEAD